MVQQGLVVFAKNKKRVSAFYQQTLGLTLDESDTSHDLLRGHGYEVVVHTIPRKYAAGITIEKPPKPRDETPFKPTFVVKKPSGCTSRSRSNRRPPQAGRRGLAPPWAHRTGWMGS
jgi:hypothetical protein